MIARPATVEGAGAVAAICNQGIEDRLATFETRLRTGQELLSWFGQKFPVVVVEDDGRVVAFAASFEHRPRACYWGVVEFSVYVERGRRGRGYGRLAMEALIAACLARGHWKLVSRVFPENVASRGLLASLGFREVGVYQKHAMLDGVWRDVVIVELLIGDARGQ